MFVAGIAFSAHRTVIRTTDDITRLVKRRRNFFTTDNKFVAENNSNGYVT